MTGIIFAMKDEISTLKKISKNISTFDSGFFKYFLFSKDNKEFVATFCGIGKANAAACTIDMIKTFSVKNILNIGTCGSCDINLDIFGVAVLKNNYYLDVDATAFGYEKGQVPQEKPFFSCENSFSDKVKNILKNNEINFLEVNGGTADSFIDLNNFKKIDKSLLKKVSCIDMESTAINQIASKKKVNTCFIKLISDSFYSQKKSEEEFKENLKKIALQTTNILNLITSEIK